MTEKIEIILNQERRDFMDQLKADMNVENDEEAVLRCVNLVGALVDAIKDGYKVAVIKSETDTINLTSIIHQSNCKDAEKFFKTR